MLTREEAIALCLALPGVYEDYPFEDTNWTAVRHIRNRKIFALIFEREGRIWVNVKVDPMWGDFWKNAYSSVVPGYHMNKRHWISIILDGSVNQADICRIIQDSYNLTK